MERDPPWKDAYSAALHDTTPQNRRVWSFLCRAGVGHPGGEASWRASYARGVQARCGRYLGM